LKSTNDYYTKNESQHKIFDVHYRKPTSVVVGPGMDINHGCPGLEAFFGFNREFLDGIGYRRVVLFKGRRAGKSGADDDRI